MNNNFSNFDIYSNRIGFFFNDKEKIGTCFGFFLTTLYILISLAIFIIYLFSTLKRVNLKVYDSTEYSKEVPYININPNLFYFSFRLENTKASSKFIDESIYYPKIIFFEKTKNNEEFIITETKELEYEICKKENFGEDYNQLFIKGELNNSYCLKDYNLTLKGGIRYNNMSYIRINLYPCVNNSKNNNHCKPQNIIDSYLKGGYFSILSKDIGLAPHNYSFPIIQTFHNLYTTIDKSIYRNIILYYGITEIKTDIGFFLEDIKSKKYIKFRNSDESFYFINEREYDNQKALISIDIKLDDLIFIQKRIYIKIHEIFFKIGGYMYFLNVIFTLLSLLSNSLIPHLKILNGIFSFNMNQKKMTLKIHTIKDFNSIVFKKTLFFPSDKQISNFNVKIQNNNVSRNSLIENNDNNSSQINIIKNKKHNSLVIIKENENEKSNNASYIKSPVCNNRKFQLRNNNNNNNCNNNYIYRVGSFYPKLMATEKKQNNYILKEYSDKLYFNLFNYYCCRNCSVRRKDIELYKLGLSLYKKRMDIVNVFSLLLFSEKNCLQADEFY